MKKRLLSILLCFVMVLGLLPVTAYADIPENMNTWGGKQITHVEFTAYYKEDLSANSYDKSRNTLVTGEPVHPNQIQFVPTSLTWKQGANGAATNKITAQENGSNGWRAVMTGEGEGLKDTNGNTFPLYAEGTMYRRNGNWSSGAERWDRVYATDMPNYVQGDYRYRLYFKVLDQYLQKNGVERDQFRIANSVTVTVKWLNSSMKENFTVHPGGGMGICNYKDNSMFVSTAGFLSSTISVTGTGRLKMGNGNAIASVYAGEEIKPFSVVNLVSGGTTPYIFSKVSGPEGIEVAADGTVHGKPRDESSAEQTLTIKVTDAVDAIATTTITVNPIKAARKVITGVELAGLYQPKANDDTATNRAYITGVTIKDGDVERSVPVEESPLHISQIMSAWWVKNDNKWERIYNDSLFQVGKEYRYDIQLRIDDDTACTQYRMAEDMTVTAQGFSTERFTLSSYSDETNYTDPYQSCYVDSPVVTAGSAQHLNGKITYTGAAQFHLPLNAHAQELPTELDGSTLKWQWQYSYTGGSTWQNVSVTTSPAVVATTTTITLDESDEYLMGKLIRAVAYSTDPNFSGAIYGAPLTVEKGWNMGIPTKPELTYDAANGKLAVTTDSYRDNQEYCWTTERSVNSETNIATWPTNNVGTGSSKNGVTEGTTYYVYTRIKGSDTMEAGRIISAAVYTVPTPRDEAAGSNTVQDLYYPEYASKTPTVYVPKNGNITITYAISSDTENPQHNQPRWKNSYTATDSTSASVNVNHNPENKTLTITAGGTVGTVDVFAYKPNTSTDEKWYFGGTADSDAGRRITVEVYDPNDLTTIPFPTMPQDLGTVTLFKGDSYDVAKSALLALPFVPDGISKDGYTLAAQFTTHGAAGSVSSSLTNSYVSLDSDENKFVVKGDEKTESSVLIEFSAVPSNLESPNLREYRIATLTVNVKARPALTDFAINPSTVTLPKGSTYQLTAIKTPSDAGGAIEWSVEEGKTGIVTVNANGKITTGNTAGTASVYATCNDVTVYSVVTVKNECDNHRFYYVSVGSYGHKGVCAECGYTESGAQPHDLRFYEDEGNKMHSECPTCGYRSDLMDVPASPANNQPYRPSSRPSSGSSTTTTTEKVNSAKTGDVGIALYAVLALTSYTGSALVIRGRKRK